MEMTPLKTILLNAAPSAEEREELFQLINDYVLQESPWMRTADFRSFHPEDVEHMFDCYDNSVFRGQLRASLDGRPLSFRISKRQTRAAGKTMWRRYKVPVVGVPQESFEISVSSHLLFSTFRDETREVTVTGLRCANRLEAMQRVLEHEIIHLAELLVWQDSKCTKSRFQDIAGRLFGHQEHTHNLVTTREIASQVHGIRRGSAVEFEFEGIRYRGVVANITKRATVLVPSDRGVLYSDGRRYLKFYIPLPCLTPVIQ